MTETTSPPDTTSRQLRLAARPVGEPKASDFELVEAPLPQGADGEFVVEITHISVDPAMRGWMSAAPSYLPPVEIGEAMRALTLGRVIASRNEGFAEGELVQGAFGVQEHAISDGARVVFKIIPSEGISRAAHLGVLGMTGMTAYFGLLDVGRLEDGDTVLVSGAPARSARPSGRSPRSRGLASSASPGAPEKCAMLVGLRLHRALPGSDRGAVGLAGRGPARERRGHRAGRHRGLPERAAAAVQRPEHRHARARVAALTQ